MRDFKFGSYLKEKIGYKIGDRTANILVDMGYIGNDVFLAPQGLKVIFEYIAGELTSQPYFDFSTPANSVISGIKAIGSVASIAIGIDSIRSLLGAYSREKRAPQPSEG